MELSNHAKIYKQLAAEGNRIIAQERKQALKAHHSKSIPMRYRAMCFNDISVSTPKQQYVFKTLMRYVETIETRLAQGTSLIITGASGTGKTTYVSAMLNALIEKNIAVLYTTCQSMMNKLKLSGWQNELHAMQSYMRTQVLVIDDTPHEGLTLTDKRRLFEVIDYRYQNKFCTIVMSHFNVQTIRTIIGEKILDRVYEHGVVLHFDWASYRTKK